MTPRTRPCMMAHPADESDDSPMTSAAWIAACVAFLLWVYVMSGAPLMWPVPR